MVLSGDRDVADYSDMTLGVSVNLALNSAAGQQSGTDTLIGIEDAAGGAGDDQFTWATYAPSGLVDGGGGMDMGVVFGSPGSSVGCEHRWTGRSPRRSSGSSWCGSDWAVTSSC